MFRSYNYIKMYLFLEKKIWKNFVVELFCGCGGFNEII